MYKLVPSETTDLFKGKEFRLSSLEHDLGTENTKALIMVDGVKVFFVIFYERRVPGVSTLKVDNNLIIENGPINPEKVESNRKMIYLKQQFFEP